MNLELDEIIKNLSSLYKEKFEGFYGIILFGSAVRGGMKDDSYIDSVLYSFIVFFKYAS